MKFVRLSLLPAMPTANELACDDDLPALAENVAGDLLQASAHTRQRPRLRHAGVRAALGVEAGSVSGLGAAGPGVCRTLDAPELHLRANARTHDVHENPRSRCRLLRTSSGGGSVSAPPYAPLTPGLSMLWAD